MENILDLSIVLPIKTNLVKDFVELFTKSIESIQLQSIARTNTQAFDDVPF